MTILYNLCNIYEIFILFNEDSVENMLQIVTIPAGFNICYTDFQSNIRIVKHVSTVVVVKCDMDIVSAHK